MQVSPEDVKEQAILGPGESLFVSEAPNQKKQSIEEEKKPQPSDQTLFYTQEDDGDDLQDGEDLSDFSGPFVMPFQSSIPMRLTPPSEKSTTQKAPEPPRPGPSKREGIRSFFTPLRLLLFVGIGVITLFVGALLVFAQPAALDPQPTAKQTGVQGAEEHPQPKVTPQPPMAKKPEEVKPQPKNQDGAQPNQAPANSVKPLQPSVPPQQTLDGIGWTNAGLSLGDAIEAQRTASTFVDREMSYDYRSIGAPDAHGGTLTSAMFLLTPGGKTRFAQNDVRVVDNTLCNKVRDGKIIQQMLGTQVKPVQFQTQQIQGTTYQFAWMNVSFQLLQLKIDLGTGKRVEGVEMDPASGQPKMHQMAVVLVRNAPENQGGNAPMGGTGWLVNLYALDQPNLPDIATIPSV